MVVVWQSCFSYIRHASWEHVFFPTHQLSNVAYFNQWAGGKYPRDGIFGILFSRFDPMFTKNLLKPFYISILLLTDLFSLINVGLSGYSVWDLFFLYNLVFSMFPLYYCFAPVAGCYSNPFHKVSILKSVCSYMFYILFLSHHLWFSRNIKSTKFWFFSFCMHCLAPLWSKVYLCCVPLLWHFSPFVIQGLSLLRSLTVTFLPRCDPRFIFVAFPYCDILAPLWSKVYICCVPLLWHF